MDKINKIGLTLQELQKKAKKQSDNPKALGWFQRFNTGSAPINNAFFNQGTGPVESPSGNGEVAAPDGGIGAVGPVGESMENKDKTTFYYNKKLQLKEGEDQNLNEDDLVVEVVVDKEDIINAIKYLLRYDSNFVDYSDEDFDKTVCDHWESIRDDYYDELHDFFRNKEAHEGEGCDCENFTDEFYDDEVEVPEEEEEVDPDFTSTMFEGIDSDDPKFEPEYDTIDFTEIEDFLDKKDLNNLLYDAYSYGFEGNGSFDNFLKSTSAYNNGYLTNDDIDELKSAFKDGESDREAQYTEFEECIHPYLESNSYKEPTNPYDDVVDNFYGYDSDLTDEYDEKHPYRYYDNEEDEDEFDYDDEPLEESAMSDLDLDLQDPKFTDKLEKNITALKDELDFLKNQAPKEIRRGGAFDSQEEIDDAIKETDRELAREKAKLAIIRRGQR